MGLFLLLTGCNESNKNIFPGYIDGDYLYISSNYGGILKSLLVTPGQLVSINQPLFALDPLPEEDTVLVAKARVTQAKADLQRVSSDYLLQKTLFDRKKILYKQEVIPKEEFDVVKANYYSVKSQLDSINSNIQALEVEQRKAEWAVKQKKVFSSDTALVFDTYYSVGEQIPINSPVLSLLKPGSIKIIFYSPEPSLKELKLNQLITVSCDGCVKPIKAKIAYISPSAEYTPPVIYSSESRKKLSYRIEALPLINDALSELHPGQPVSVSLK
jgi:HlyD family secretion protein